ncbi:hypothetical protein M0R04_05005 [Candidatus Dojkabacteria bacterium]|jgi:hypothetical protein|nr:hypothetical protein [Candidatus Dojkabacteria bacterium]
MKKIYKYKLEITDNQKVTLPVDSDFLSCQMQNGELCMWVLVNPNEKETFTAEILVIGTGNPIKEDLDNYGHMATVQDGSLVWHVFGEL